MNENVTKEQLQKYSDYLIEEMKKKVTYGSYGMGDPNFENRKRRMKKIKNLFNL